MPKSNQKKIKIIEKTSKELWAFWKRAFMKAFSVAGFTFFSLVVTMGWNWSSLEPSIVAGGLYLFSEAVKYFNLQPKNKVLKDHSPKYNFIV